MSRGVRIIGVGSPFGADSLGWAVARELARPLRTLAPDIRCCDRPGVGLLDHLAGAEFAIVIDAMEAGLAPGSIRCFRPGELFRTARRHGRSPCSSHDFGVVEALALGHRLDCLPSRLHVLGIQPGGDAAACDVSRLAGEAARLIMALTGKATANGEDI